MFLAHATFPLCITGECCSHTHLHSQISLPEHPLSSTLALNMVRGEESSEGFHISVTHFELEVASNSLPRITSFCSTTWKLAWKAIHYGLEWRKSRSGGNDNNGSHIPLTKNSFLFYSSKVPKFFGSNIKILQG